MKKSLVVVLVVLFSISVAANAYLYLTMSDTDKKLTDAKSQLSTQETKVTMLEKKIAEQPQEKDMTKDDAASETVAKDEESKTIIETAKAYAMTRGQASVTIKIEKQIDDAVYLSVTPAENATETVGGYGLVMKKSNNIWVPVMAAQNFDPSQEEVLKNAGVPLDIIKS